MEKLYFDLCWEFRSEQKLKLFNGSIDKFNIICELEIETVAGHPK